MVALQEVKRTGQSPSVWPHDTGVTVCQEDRWDRPCALPAKVFCNPFNIFVRDAIIEMPVIDLDRIILLDS
jgi:hypothetical protein